MNSINLKNKTVLVTGSAGFIGSNLVLELLRTQSPINIIGLDNMNNYYDVSIKEWRLKEIEKCVSEHNDSTYASNVCIISYLDNYYTTAVFFNSCPLCLVFAISLDFSAVRFTSSGLLKVGTAFLRASRATSSSSVSHAAFNSSSFTSISCSHSGVSRSIKIMLFGVLSSSSVFTRSSSYNFSPGRKPKYVK